VIVGDVGPARAGVRHHQDDAVLGGVALRPGLGDEVLLVAGQPAQPVQHRARPVPGLRREVHAYRHVAAQYLGAVAVDVLPAAVGGAVFDAFGHGFGKSVVDDGTDALAFVHQVERFVDALQRHGVGDVGVQCQLPAHGLPDHAGELGAALDATKGRAAPDAAGDELERAGADLLPGAGDADDDALAPALVAALQRRA